MTLRKGWKMPLPGSAARAPLLGAAAMIASTVAFAGMHAIVRHLSAELHPFEIAFFRNLFGVFVLLPWLVRSRGRLLATRRFGHHGIRAALNLVAMLLFFMALGNAPLAQVQALGFTSPLFAAVLAMLLLGERLHLRRVTALVIGFGGALMVTGPFGGTVEVGAVYALVSAAFWAAALVIIKSLSRTDSSLTITAWMVLLLTPMSLLPALLVWQWPDGTQWFWLVCCGVVGTLAQALMTQALRLADATAVLPLDFLKMVWGAGLGYVLFGETPGLWTWLGGITIFVGATYVTLRESRSGALPARPAAASPEGLDRDQSGPPPRSGV